MCGGRIVAALAGAASLRGRRWAEEVVRTLVLRWPRSWPSSPRAAEIARRRISDLAKNGARQVRLIRFCMEAAQARYLELTDYLVGRRLGVPEDDSTERIEGVEELPK
jgi:hypothetical protein